MRRLLPTLLLTVLSWTQTLAAEDLQLLFLGDNGHHRPVDRFEELAPALEKKGVLLKYTDEVSDINEETLKKFDGLVLYANIDEISKEQADALLKYVADGNGFIPLHCATYCFRNDARIVALMGAQFQQHGGEVFSTVNTAPDHPIMKDYGGFESWDETYVHRLHNKKNRTVLEVRKQGLQADGNNEEPWTWIRTHGKGRVFYTAWGHDSRTWTDPGFQNLVERGIRWACGRNPEDAGPHINTESFQVPQSTQQRTDVQPFEYLEVGAKIPNYLPSNKWGVQGDPLTKMQLPLPAEESVKHFITPVDFHLEIYATEKFGDSNKPHPQYAGFVGKPIAMNWDERGRLWVCETVDYPNELKPHNKGRDHIRICEDTNQDGYADKFTLFASGLSIPTAIAFHRGGVIVQNGTETLWLKDTDGDDVADQREVIISNWNLGDTHGGVSNLRYGLDNWFWGMQGYNMSEPIITATGEKQSGFRMGFWRFKLDDSEPPAVTQLEFVRSTNNNTWGLGFSEEGLIFGSTANRNPSNFMPISNRYYEQVRGWGPRTLEPIADTHLFKPTSDRVRQVDHHGGYTAAAGHALYTSRNYPQQWWNRTAFVCGPTGKLVGTFVLHPDGSGYRSTSPMNLISSDDEWSAPIAAEVGPDGNVWILDWYNYIVQHNPTPQGFQTGQGRAYQSDLRDKKHGRVYRLLYDNKPVNSFKRLDINRPEELISALRDPSMLVRLHAQRLLIERGKTDIASEMYQLIENQEQDAIGLNVGAMHALGVLQGLGEFDKLEPDSLSILTSALKHPASGVRRIALHCLPQSLDSQQLLLKNESVNDKNIQVQLAALLAISNQETSQQLGALVAEQFLKQQVTNDRWLADALTAAAASHVVSFVQSLTANRIETLTDKQTEIIKIITEHFARGKPDGEQLEQLVTPLVKSHPQIAAAVLEGLGNGWQSNHSVQIKPELENAMVKLLSAVPTASKGRVIQLGTSWGSTKLEEHVDEIIDSLLKVVRDEKLQIRQRTASAAQLVEFQPQNEEIVEELLEDVTAQSPPEFVNGIMNALKASRANNLGHELVNRSRSLTPFAREIAMQVMLARPATTIVFLDNVDAGKIRISDLSLEQKRTLTDHPDKAIRVRARKIMEAGGGLPNPDREKVVQQMLPLTHQKGDAKLGQAVFVKHCSKCHRHGETGENIGPNLTGMVVHPKEELLIHILDPSRSVEGNFRLYTVVTTEGRLLSGMMAAESRTSIELIDTEAKRKTLARADIEELLASPKSLMPEGFEKQMTPEEMKNLLEFLTDKGKFIPIDLQKIATINSTQPMFYGSAPQERLVFPDWKPKVFQNIPFLLVDPKGNRSANVVMLYGPQGVHPPKMPKRVEFQVNSQAKKIHILGGIGGWNFPAIREKSTSVILRIHYADHTQENHELKNGVHIADYIRHIDVPESKFAYDLNGQQVRFLTISPQNSQKEISRIELIKGADRSAPIFVAITIETP